MPRRDIDADARVRVLERQLALVERENSNLRHQLDVALKIAAWGSGPREPRTESERTS